MKIEIELNGLGDGTTAKVLQRKVIGLAVAELSEMGLTIKQCADVLDMSLASLYRYNHTFSGETIDNLKANSKLERGVA